MMDLRPIQGVSAYPTVTAGRRQQLSATQKQKTGKKKTNEWVKRLTMLTCALKTRLQPFVNFTCDVSTPQFAAAAVIGNLLALRQPCESPGTPWARSVSYMASKSESD